jgi:hypothetical protein
MLSILIPVLLSLQPTDTTEIYFLSFINSGKISEIEEKTLILEAGTRAGRILSKQGYLVTDSSGFPVHLSINKLETPVKNYPLWTIRDYIVETEICIGSGCYTGTGKKRTYTFRFLPKVKNTEAPFIEKDLYRALEESIEDASKFTHKKSPE